MQTNVEENLVFALDDGAVVPWYSCSTGHKRLKYFEDKSSLCMYCTLSADLSGFALGNQGSRGRTESSNYVLIFCQLLIKVKLKMARI